jgi:hypothetical protein
MKPRRRNATECSICGGGRCKRRRRRDARGPHVGADVSWAICAPCSGHLAAGLSWWPDRPQLLHRSRDRSSIPRPVAGLSWPLPEDCPSLLGTYPVGLKPVLEVIPTPTRTTKHPCRSVNGMASGRIYPRQMVRRGFRASYSTSRIQLMPGENWYSEIVKAVHDSDVALICLSRESVNKQGYVQKEIRFALEAAADRPEDNVSIIPVRLEPSEIPESLNRFQYVDLFDDGYETLVRALKRVKTKRIGNHPSNT